MADQEQLSVEDLYGAYEPSAGSGLFMKFEDDKEQKVRIASEPYVLQSSFEDKKTGEITTSVRHAWIVINRNDDNKVAIMQLPGDPYTQVADLVRDEDFGDPTKYDLKITRKNTNGRYSYNVVGSPKRSELTDEEKVAVLGVDILEAIGKNGTPVLSLRNYLAAGKKFPGTAGEVKDLD